MRNYFLVSHRRKTIVEEMNRKFVGVTMHEDELLDYLWSHPSHLEGMVLNVFWADEENGDVAGVEVWGGDVAMSD